MTVGVKVALASVLLSIPVLSAQAQIDAESIAAAIARDSGNPVENYLSYGAKLTTTLKLLSPQQLARVFGEGTNVVVPETLNQLLEMGDVNFRGGSPQLSPQARLELDKVAEFLALNPKTRISIEGHAQYHNHEAQPLSEKRALSAANYLASLGISMERMETEGFGASRPLIDDPDRSRTAANRRIEIRVIEEE